MRRRTVRGLKFRELTILENKRLFGLICYLNREMTRRNMATLSSFGLTGAQLQALVYVHISGAEGKRVCQRDIERELNLRASSVSSMLKNLTSCGYVTRSLSEGDARAKFIELTEKGEELCLKNRELMDSCDALVQSALSEEERASLQALLLKIMQHLQN